MRRLVVVLAACCCAVAAAFLLASPAQAHKRFARKEGVECKECHQSPEGGGPRNVIGQYYQAKGELPPDRSPETMKLVESTVERWMLEMIAQPPVIRWGYKPLASQVELPAPSYTPLPDHALLRRLSLDLRGTTPTEKELDRLTRGELTLDRALDEFLASKDFQSTFHLYHKDLIRPRTGIFHTSVSLTRVSEVSSGGSKVYVSDQLRTEPSSGACSSDRRRTVSPWWNRKTSVAVCEKTASDALSVTVAGKTVRCDTQAGQQSGACGCGPHLVFCYPDGIRNEVIKSQKEELAKLAMEIVNNDLSYGEMLTADWTMLDGKLEVFYSKIWGKLADLKDPDADRGWHRFTRGPEHAGALSSPAMLNFFYNGRRWSQRVFEAFMCHEPTPDFDLLDDTVDSGESIAIPYRDSPDLMPTIAVTDERPCAACHLQLDGVSRIKDRWNYFGEYFERMPDARAMPIPQNAMFLGREVDGMDGFGKALSESEVFHDCVASQLWEHMVGHRFTTSETGTRKALVDEFQRSNLNFKALIRAIAKTPEYRAKENPKLMMRELYSRSMGRATDVAWKVGDKGGWDAYYDKVGGMDYRKIEFRDRSPGQGHSLAQFKGAAESCSELVTREDKKEAKDRLWLKGIDDVNKMPSDKQIEEAVARLYARAVTRPWSEVSADEKKLMLDLFRTVSRRESPTDGWRAVCTAVFGSEDYALF